ncbi:MAG: helix-turn-helix domain-containing protein [Bifidobacteriaceae bacterium]|jgi:excisionase family DNA binding protein|nr:helix-turn-helix domain-containing protein [Bifidobacteriaceae bacterium]
MSVATGGGSLPELVSYQAVLEWLGVSKATFTRWTRDGKAPPRIKVGGHVLFRQDQLLAWLDDQQMSPAAPSEPAPGLYDEWR